MPFFQGEKKFDHVTSKGKPRLNYSDSSTHGLVGLWLMDEDGLDLTGNNDVLQTGSITHGYEIGGSFSHVTNDNTSDRLNLGSIDSGNPLSCNANNEMSILAILKTTSTGISGNAFPRIIDKSSAGTSANGWGLVGFNTFVDFYVAGGAATFSGAITLGLTQALGITYVPGATRCTVDGAFFSEVTSLNNTIPTTTTNAAISNWNHATDRQCRSPIFFVAVWDRAIPEELMMELELDQSRLFLPEEEIFFFPSSGATNISATSQALILTEFVTTVTAETSVSATQQSLVITENAVTVNAETNVTATQQSLVITEFPATISSATGIDATSQALILTEFPAGVTSGSATNINATQQSLILTEFPATVASEVNVNVTQQSLILTENTATINAETSVSATQQSLVLLEFNTTITIGAFINATTQPLVLTEFVATVEAKVFQPPWINIPPVVNTWIDV